MFQGGKKSAVISTFIHEAFEMQRGQQNFKSANYRGKSQTLISLSSSVVLFL